MKKFADVVVPFMLEYAENEYDSQREQHSSLKKLYKKYCINGKFFMELYDVFIAIFLGPPSVELGFIDKPVEFTPMKRVIDYYTALEAIDEVLEFLSGGKRVPRDYAVIYVEKDEGVASQAECVRSEYDADMIIRKYKVEGYLDTLKGDVAAKRYIVQPRKEIIVVPLDFSREFFSFCKIDTDYYFYSGVSEVDICTKVRRNYDVDVNPRITFYKLDKLHRKIVNCRSYYSVFSKMHVFAVTMNDDGNSFYRMKTRKFQYLDEAYFYFYQKYDTNGFLIDRPTPLSPIYHFVMTHEKEDGTTIDKNCWLFEWPETRIREFKHFAYLFSGEKQQMLFAFGDEQSAPVILGTKFFGYTKATIESFLLDQEYGTGNVPL